MPEDVCIGSNLKILKQSVDLVVNYFFHITSWISFSLML